MPKWKHEERAPINGTTEHLWYARFESMGVWFNVGVSVKRNPIDAVVAQGRPLITWKLRPISTPARPLSDAMSWGAGFSVGDAADVMLAPVHHDPRPWGSKSRTGFVSLLDTWAWNLVRPRLDPPSSPASFTNVELAVVPF
ncbi:MAG: hypothetical protein ACOZQL_10490 [Myxococcota bacterium]